VLSRQGVGSTFLEAAESAARSPQSAVKGPLKLLYVGRWDPVKGLDVIVRAVRRLTSGASVHLSIHAPLGGTAESAYERSVRKLANGDPGITFGPLLSRSEVAAAMARHDALVVPSLWLETGPLAVLEAQAAGLYVLASRLGGIAELVHEGVDGELVEAGSVRAWTTAIERLARRHASGALTRRPREVRTTRVVATEMAGLYQSLCRHDRVVSPGAIPSSCMAHQS
jgi:glycosyltransferase involved in cell wall biosynthesis